MRFAGVEREGRRTPATSAGIERREEGVARTSCSEDTWSTRSLASGHNKKEEEELTKKRTRTSRAQQGEHAAAGGEQLREDTPEILRLLVVAVQRRRPTFEPRS